MGGSSATARSRKDQLHADNADPAAIRQVQKDIRACARQLRNIFYDNEASRINVNAVNRQIEKVFANIQRSETTFKPVPSNDCRPDKLLTHFKQHFTAPPLQSTPADLISQPPPQFIANLQQLSVQNPVNHDPPSLDEAYDACKTAKNRKASSDIPSEFLKHARDCPQFLQ